MEGIVHKINLRQERAGRRMKQRKKIGIFLRYLCRAKERRKKGEEGRGTVRNTDEREEKREETRDGEKY